MSAIQSAVAAVGGQTALAKIILVSPQAVNQWVTKGCVSHKKVLAVERASGVSRNLLRPDLYPGEASALQEIQEVQEVLNALGEQAALASLVVQKPQAALAGG